MKLNKNKIIVSALALATGASLVGSISGTVAWYQYSTRANVSYIGQASGISSNLQMRFADEGDNAWRTRITWQEMNAKLAADMKLIPMTFGGLDKDDPIPMDNAQTPAPLGYAQPIVGVSDMTKWSKATNKNYVQFKLQLRNINREGATAQNDAQDVYLSKLVIQQDASNAANNKQDLSNAVRVHISSSYKEEGVVNNQPAIVEASKNKLISNQGETIATHGLLDLDADGHADRAYPDDDEFGFKDAAGETLQAVTYGSGNQSSYLNGTDFTAGTKWTADELDAAALVASAYGKSVDDVKTPAVYYAQSEIDNASEGDEAYGKTTSDVKTPAVYWTQDEIDLADAAHGKTVNDYKVDPKHPAVAGSEGNKLTKLEYDDDEDDETPKLNKLIGKTIESESEYLTVTITIWVEGWQKLDNDTAAWDAVKYIDSKFNVGIQFAVQDKLAE